MFKRWKLYRQFRKEVDKTVLYNEAVEHTKASFRRRGVPSWTSEYQNTFQVHVLKYCQGYLSAYAKRRYAEYLESAKVD